MTEIALYYDRLATEADLWKLPLGAAGMPTIAKAKLDITALPWGPVGTEIPLAGSPEQDEEDVLLAPDILMNPDFVYQPVPLQKLPLGPYRSLGGFLDYSNWAERDRFLELDLAIQAQSCKEETSEIESAERPRPAHGSRRCRAKLAHRMNCNTPFDLTADYDGWRCATHRAALQA